MTTLEEHFMPVDTIAHEYLSLSFAIERQFPGFIDAYFGPEEIRTQALAAPDTDPAALFRRAKALSASVADADLAPSRKSFLSAQLRAIETICRKLAGEEIAYRDEVRALFDIDPPKTDESVFEAAIEELETLLPGSGTVQERMAAFQAQFVVDRAAAEKLIRIILEEIRTRTLELVELPEDESIEIAFVTDKPWSGYNWYLGDFRSRVEINEDLPIYAHRLVGLLAHEGYPGHHTEHGLKDRRLYGEHGFGEHAIQLINTPECVISEGIATLAESIVFPGDEGIAWQAETLYPVLGISADPATIARIENARAHFRAVSANAALLLHEEGRPEEEIVDYLKRYALRNEKEARTNFRFISDPLWRAYTFTYSVGRPLLSAWLDKAPSGARLAWFKRLLTEQITPSGIRAEA
jgi:hypothetical protein